VRRLSSIVSPNRDAHGLDEIGGGRRAGSIPDTLRRRCSIFAELCGKRPDQAGGGAARKNTRSSRRGCWAVRAKPARHLRRLQACDYDRHAWQSGAGARCKTHCRSGTTRFLWRGRARDTWLRPQQSGRDRWRAEESDLCSRYAGHSRSPLMTGCGREGRRQAIGGDGQSRRDPCGRSASATRPICCSSSRRYRRPALQTSIMIRVDPSALRCRLRNIRFDNGF